MALDVRAATDDSAHVWGLPGEGSSAMFYNYPPQHDPSLRRSHETVAKLLDLIDVLCARARLGAGKVDRVAEACDAFQAFINLYESLREDEGPILCDEEEAAYEAAFKTLNIGPGKLGPMAGVLRKSVHSAVIALAGRVEKAAWDGRQNHHPACALDDVNQIVELWNPKVKPGLLKNGPRFNPDQIFECLTQE